MEQPEPLVVTNQTILEKKSAPDSQLIHQKLAAMSLPPGLKFVWSGIDFYAAVCSAATWVFLLFCQSIVQFPRYHMGEGAIEIVLFFVYTAFHSLWLQEFYDRLLIFEKATAPEKIAQRKKRRLIRKYWDNASNCHPALLILLVSALAYPISTISPTAAHWLGNLLFFVLPLYVAVPIFRWFFRIILMPWRAAATVKGAGEGQVGATALGGLFVTVVSIVPLAAIVLKASGIMDLGSFAFGPLLYIGWSGLAFAVLRNLMLANNPLDLALPWDLARLKESAVTSEVVLKYNHFVEISRWFKQKFALRSRWKLVVMAFLLFVLIKCGLPIMMGLGWLLACFLDALGAATNGGDALNGYTIAKGATQAVLNTRLLTMYIAVLGLSGATALGAFVSAPKRIVLDKKGLRLTYLKISGFADEVLPWEDLKHVRVEHPGGKASARDDKLIFERVKGAPLSLKIGGITSTDDREKLLDSIQAYAPAVSRDVAIIERLRRPMEQNYTELWLQALAAPPKREKLKPLIAGAEMNEGRYSVVRELGSGGQGFAYLARDNKSDRTVVLKETVLPVFVDINARRQALESFEREAKLLSQLDHPQIVKLEGFFIEDHRAYLVLEHIDGDNLRLIVSKNGPLPEEQIRNLAEQMTTILQYLHALTPPLVHRDFTPDNLILRKDGTLKLIDFNVAQQVEYATTGTVVGKQAYLPPEQFRGQAVPASDLYALGATLYFLASGKDPVPISVARPRNDNIQVSEVLDQLIVSLTQIEPSDRPSDAGAVHRLLDAAKLGERHAST